MAFEAKMTIEVRKMNIPDYSNMEIDMMDKDTLLRTYLKLQETSNKLDMQMSFIKTRMQWVLEAEGLNGFTNPLGEFVRVVQQRNNFMSTKAKEFLTEEQIELCKVPKEISYIKVISTQAKTNQEAVMQLD